MAAEEPHVEDAKDALVARPLVLVSNRGPIAFERGRNGEIATKKTGGGLAAGVKPILSQTGGMWVCAPLDDADREAAREPIRVGGIDVVFSAVSSSVADVAVGEYANEYLWFLHHGLTDIAVQPRESAWLAFTEYNRAMAEAVAQNAPRGSVVLVQDYHLPLVGRFLRESRPDVAMAHFSHIPFASPKTWATIPADQRHELLEGFAAYPACGFHSLRWAQRFEECFADHQTRAPRTFVTQLAPDLKEMAARARTSRCQQEYARLAARHGDRQLIVRVDRLEPTKNHLIGVEAFADLLDRRPDLRGHVTMVAYAYPSRSALGAYRRLRSDLVEAVDVLNRRLGTDDWIPIELDLEDDLDAAVAGLMIFDILLVNPIEDGLNLVAFEGAALNERSGTIVLSENCGAHDVLLGCVQSIDPHDVLETSESLERGLSLPGPKREEMAADAANRATTMSSTRWLGDQVRASSALQEGDDLGR